MHDKNWIAKINIEFIRLFLLPWYAWNVFLMWMFVHFTGRPLDESQFWLLIRWNCKDLSTHWNITLNITQTCISSASSWAFAQIVRSLSSPLIYLRLPVTMNAFVIYVFSFYSGVALVTTFWALFKRNFINSICSSFLFFFFFFSWLISVPWIKIGLRCVYTAFGFII